MKRVLLTIALLIYTVAGYAQLKESDRKAQLPIQKHEENPHPFDKAWDRYSGMYIGWGSHQTDFLNGQYGQYRKDKILRRRFGSSLSVGYTYYPFSVELQWFSSGFRTNKDNWVYPDSTKIRHRGLELSGTYFFIPQAKRFAPYVSLGFQTASLGVGNWLENTDDPNKKGYIKKSHVGMSAAIWKAGFRIDIGKELFLFTEYKRSIARGEKSFGQVYIGIAFISKNKTIMDKYGFKKRQK